MHCIIHRSCYPFGSIYSSNLAYSIGSGDIVEVKVFPRKLRSIQHELFRMCRNHSSAISLTDLDLFGHLIRSNQLAVCLFFSL